MYQLYRKIMRSPLHLSLLALFLLLTTGVVVRLIISANTFPEMKQCTATITESMASASVQARFSRVVTILHQQGFAHDTGTVTANGKQWRYNRFYTFTLAAVEGDTFRLTLASGNKSFDDAVPDAIMHRLRPETGRQTHITRIEQVAPGVWLFSGLAFPLYACRVSEPH